MPTLAALLTEELGDLARHVDEIGQVMVSCDRHCEGIHRNPCAGILPRCLVLESQNWGSGRGCVILGLNPGQSRDQEHRYYGTHGATYKSVVKYWQDFVRERKYYHSLRHLADQLGLSGPILWTELAKCEKDPDFVHVPLQTLRTCVSLYLRPELECTPNTWALLAAGREAFRAAAYLCPERAVLGVPHPMGAWGGFKQFENLSPDLRARARQALDSTDPQAIWLPARPAAEASASSSA
jgi:hypothetical protein